jgi:hypothetical protein
MAKVSPQGSFSLWQGRQHNIFNNIVVLSTTFANWLNHDFGDF